MIPRLILVVLFLAGLFGGIFGWKHYQAQQRAVLAATPPPPATVAAAEVRPAIWQRFLHSVGSLVASEGISVTNEVAGQVRRIYFDSGHRVNAGELLLQLDDTVDRAELEGLAAERRLAEVQHQRIARLVEDKSASQSTHDETRANLDNARARVASKQALIDKKAIRAPFDGLLGIRQVDIGEYLAPGSQIVPLQALDPIHADYAVPEKHFGELREGQAVLIEVPAYPSEVFEGRITAFDPGIDPGTRSVRIRATLANPDGRLRPGMFAQVRTVLPDRAELLTIPQTAVTYNPYGDAVFIITEQEDGPVVERRQVQVGDVRDGWAEVVAGLERGDRVVSAGQVKLRNGQPVRIDNTVSLSGGKTGP